MYTFVITISALDLSIQSREHLLALQSDNQGFSAITTDLVNKRSRRLMTNSKLLCFSILASKKSNTNQLTGVVLEMISDLKKGLYFCVSRFFVRDMNII